MIWLASYPKSGNTWVRALLSNYLQNDAGPTSINRLIGSSIHIDRHLFDETMGLASADMTPEEIAHNRPIFHQELSEQSPGLNFVKTHDAFNCPRSGEPLYPKEADSAVIYLVRNPLDIVTSFSHHQNKTVDEMIDFMADANAKLRGGNARFDQHLGAWSDHVTGWTRQNSLKLLTVRYEDLITDTIGTFAKIIRFSGLDYDATRLQQAVEFAKFETLQQIEQEEGFDERQPTAQSFFRSGQAGEGRKNLSDRQVAKIVESHRDLMFRFAYI